MGWPVHLQPLPSIFADPFLYFLTLEHCSSQLTYQSMRTTLLYELGNGETFGKLFAHVSKDILNRLLKNKTLSTKESAARESAKDFVRVLLEDNHLEYQAELQRKAAEFLRDPQPPACPTL